MPKTISPTRIRDLNQAPKQPEGEYVLYWMIAARRSRWNFALQHAIHLAAELNVGLLVFEPLRCDYPFACDRFHRFILEGMRDNVNFFNSSGVTYYPWVETSPGEGRGLLQALADKACAVITDDMPTTFITQMLAKAASKLNISLHAIDGNGLLPLQLVDKEYPTAYVFRRFLHKALPAFIDDQPQVTPLKNCSLPQISVDREIQNTWPLADLDALLGHCGLKSLPIDHQVEPTTQIGGSRQAEQQLDKFLDHDFDQYSERRNIPDADCTSRLSAYLHFGHISAHQIFSQLATREKWSSRRLNLRPSGKRHGWWGMSETAEDFLDELVTWRELGFGFSSQRNDFAEYNSLPAWARESLQHHSHDERPYYYDYDQFQRAETHDPLWNAAQRQLLREGRIHGYLRMLWGKKILEWSPTPQQAMEIMIELNDRYALDGRDPNSYSGIGWCLGRFDRAWGPERPIFGKIRYMTSKNTARKVAVKDYLKRYAAEPQSDLFSDH